MLSHLCSIVIRRLTVPDYEAFNEQFFKFCIDSLGLPYIINAKILLKRFGYYKQYKSQTRSYFCSELIADCYKKAGVLGDDIDSATFWPGDFTTKSTKLKMKPGFDLSYETKIVFSN